MRQLAATLLCLAFGLAIGAALLLAPQPGHDLPAQIAAALPDSGVGNPVTAVLLNFRSYDTMLEIAVLLIAAVAGLALQQSAATHPPLATLEDALLPRLLQWLAPLMLLLAAWLLWAGSKQPGGAFQGGAVLAAAGVLLRVAGYGMITAPWLLRAGLVLGLAVFLGVAMGTLLAGRALLEYPPAHAGTLILVVETAMTVSIGMILLSLFAAAGSTLDPRASDAGAYAGAAAGTQDDRSR